MSDESEKPLTENSDGLDDETFEKVAERERNRPAAERDGTSPLPRGPEIVKG
jgi:hypothetical protein